jgi:hypothetical protein
MAYLTLDQFRATREDVDDIGFRLDIDFGITTPTTGYIYDGSCYIERREAGDYYLNISRSDWIDNDLERLERILWAEHYLAEHADPDADFLSKRDGTLDDYVRACFDARGMFDGYGDVMGQLMSGSEEWHIQDAFDACYSGWLMITAPEEAQPTQAAPPKFWKVAHYTDAKWGYFYHGGAFPGATPQEAIKAALGTRPDDGRWIAFPCDATGRVL